MSAWYFRAAAPAITTRCFCSACSPEWGHCRSWSFGSSPALFFPVPIGSPRARVFRSKTVLCNSFQQSNNPPLQRSSSLIQLTSQNSSPNQQRAPQVIGVMQSQNSSAGNRGPRPLEQVTCYKVSLGVGGQGRVFTVSGHSLTPQKVHFENEKSLFLLIIKVGHWWAGGHLTLPQHTKTR